MLQRKKKSGDRLRRKRKSASRVGDGGEWIDRNRARTGFCLPFETEKEESRYKSTAPVVSTKTCSFSLKPDHVAAIAIPNQRVGHVTLKEGCMMKLMSFTVSCLCKTKYAD